MTSDKYTYQPTLSGGIFGGILETLNGGTPMPLTDTTVRNAKPRDKASRILSTCRYQWLKILAYEIQVFRKGKNALFWCIS